MSWFILTKDGLRIGLKPLMISADALTAANKTMIPQSVTSRYARNLMAKGHNNEFYIIQLKRENCYVDGAWLANYYVVEIASGGLVKSAAGATPEQAITRCLGEKYGVTFR